MPKAKVKENKGEPAAVLPEGMKPTDLSLEKRQELFQAAFGEFEKVMREEFGLGLGAEIVWSPRAAVPRITMVDLLAKKEDGKATTAPKS